MTSTSKAYLAGRKAYQERDRPDAPGYSVLSREYGEWITGYFSWAAPKVEPHPDACECQDCWHYLNR